MPSRTTMVRAKSTKSKGKVQPTTAGENSSVSPQPRASFQNGTHVQVTRAPTVTSPSVGGSSQLPTQSQAAVTAQQSLDVVQTFLFSAVSTVLWMRDLLPQDYFRTAFYASINKHCSYRDFMHGSDDGTAAQGERSRPKGYHLSVLKRDVSARGDQIIQWLESGVFEAIRQGYLGQLQIAIFADDEQPTEVLELYCFHFQYSDHQDGSITVSLEVEDIQTKKTVSLKDARGALNTVVKNMVGLNGTMPHLPERCFMSPYLIWNDRRPSGYQPPDFHPSEEVNVSFPATDGWAMETSTCGQVKTGFQSVHLGIAYTKSTSSDDVDDEAVVMPGFIYGETFSRLDPFSIQTALRKHRPEVPDSVPHSLPTPRQSSAVGSDEEPSMPTAQTRRSITNTQNYGTRIILPNNTGGYVGTQDKEDLSRIKALQPVEPDQINDTQLVFRPAPSSPDMDLSATITTQEIHQKQGGTKSSQNNISGRYKSPEPITMSCECGTEENDNIIQCHNCNCWQHAQCYAYEGPDDTRLPAEHSCYTCRFGDAADQRLEEVGKFARTRQVIHSIRVRGLNSPTKIAEVLGYKRAEVMELLQGLRHNDIAQVKNAKKRSEYIIFASSEESKQAMMELYLDPLKDIEKCVEDAATGRTIHSTPKRKRTDHGFPDDGHQPKTPRLSRPYTNLPFDSNTPYTPNNAN